MEFGPTDERVASRCLRVAERALTDVCPYGLFRVPKEVWASLLRLEVDGWKFLTLMF